jgi:hypothetical protein
MENESGRKRNALPLACSLSERDLAKRRRELAENVAGGVLKVDELEDGYAFVFPGSAEWAARLVELVNAERTCCPFFAFELVFQPDLGPVLLKIRRPEGAKELTETELATLRSGRAV